MLQRAEHRTLKAAAARIFAKLRLIRRDNLRPLGASELPSFRAFRASELPRFADPPQWPSRSAKDSFHSGIGDGDNIAELLRQAEFDHASE